MQKVEANLASMLPRGSNQDHSLTIDVSFPQVIEGLVSEKVLVMSYIDGFKIDNKEMLEKHQADKASLVQNVTKAFAQQIFVDGFYTADPVNQTFPHIHILNFRITIKEYIVSTLSHSHHPPSSHFSQH